MRLAKNILLSATLLAGVGCGSGERTYRQYEEMTMRRPPQAPMASSMPPAGSSPMASAMGALPEGMNQPAADLHWTTPDGWEELPGDGVRLVTFRMAGAECSVTTFPGDVGGVEANLRRWWGQLSSTAFSAPALDQVMGQATPLAARGGITGQLYDFDAALPADAPNSTVAAILDLGGSTAFVKLTGKRDVLQAQKPALLALAQSMGLDR
ncbi:MAG: hypothetical protein KDL31_03710 [Kiritimatiellae bacterium]|nr:hypothetical protein [Kiritimatiellia bacterium]